MKMEYITARAQPTPKPKPKKNPMIEVVYEGTASMMAQPALFHHHLGPTMWKDWFCAGRTPEIFGIEPPDMEM